MGPDQRVLLVAPIGVLGGASGHVRLALGLTQKVLTRCR
jgi:hypothetical protein